MSSISVLDVILDCDWKVLSCKRISVESLKVCAFSIFFFGISGIRKTLYCTGRKLGLCATSGQSLEQPRGMILIVDVKMAELISRRLLVGASSNEPGASEKPPFGGTKQYSTYAVSSVQLRNNIFCLYCTMQSSWSLRKMPHTILEHLQNSDLGFGQLTLRRPKV